MDVTEMKETLEHVNLLVWQKEVLLAAWEDMTLGTKEEMDAFDAMQQIDNQMIDEIPALIEIGKIAVTLQSQLK